MPLLFVNYSCSAQAISRKPTDHKLIEAYSQEKLSGVPGGSGATYLKFILKWTGKGAPEFIYWKGTADVVQCRIERAHKVVERPRDMPAGIDYFFERNSQSSIVTGDTVMVSALKGAVEKAPSSVMRGRRNTLYVRSGGKWSATSVKNIIKKKAIAMP
ncbi:MAG: hypothetical protein IAE95_12175 [Chitinophagaceae bacterium]|nr:hypothetical protein [Chitinophagaceae bacterium]